MRLDFLRGVDADGGDISLKLDVPLFKLFGRRLSRRVGHDAHLALNVVVLSYGTGTTTTLASSRVRDAGVSRNVSHVRGTPSGQSELRIAAATGRGEEDPLPDHARIGSLGVAWSNDRSIVQVLISPFTSNVVFTSPSEAATSKSLQEKMSMLR